jgi:hypothetical protein
MSGLPGPPPSALTDLVLYRMPEYLYQRNATFVQLLNDPRLLRTISGSYVPPHLHGVASAKEKMGEKIDRAEYEEALSRLPSNDRDSKSREMLQT